MSNESKIAAELQRVLKRQRKRYARIGHEDTFDQILAIYRQNPLLNLLMTDLKPGESPYTKPIRTRKKRHAPHPD